jgi:hypothetical protein
MCWLLDRTTRAAVLRWLLALAIGLSATNLVWAQTEEIHGSGAVFASDDIGIVWAVHKQATGDKATVWWRIVNRKAKFSHVSMDGVDPFSKKRERVTPTVALSAELNLSSDRDTFADLTSRQIHFYLNAADAQADKPAVTVYYLGVPDTVPEFTDEAKMNAYLREAKLVSHALKTLTK